jgi:hypothetical protein
MSLHLCCHQGRKGADLKLQVVEVTAQEPLVQQAAYEESKHCQYPQLPRQ